MSILTASPQWIAELIRQTSLRYASSSMTRGGQGSRASGLPPVDQKPQALRDRTYALTVIAGPDAGKTLALEGTAVVGSDASADFSLSDPSVAPRHLEVTVRPEGVRLRDLDSATGTLVGSMRIETVVVPDDATLTLGSTRLRLGLRDAAPLEPPSEQHRFGRAVGQSVAMRRLFGLLQRAAARDVSVMLRGETGTGKEVLAEALHLESGRRGKPFVVVDCGAIAPDLIESELFGHVKGAFTGAVADRLGAFLQADGGTVFLDEIGELPMALQPKLLRALEAGTIKRVGEDQPRKIDVRVICATHRDLEAFVAAGRFRRDLYFRLAVVVADVPPLRDRLEDLPLLVEEMVKAMGAEDFVPPAALFQTLDGHTWPGNVRELRNVIQRAVAGLRVDAPGNISSKGSATLQAAGYVANQIPFREAKEQLVEAFTREYLAELLEQCKGNLSAVARKSKLNRNYVRRLVIRYGLKTTDS